MANYYIYPQNRYLNDNTKYNEVTINDPFISNNSYENNNYSPSANNIPYIHLPDPEITINEKAYQTLPSNIAQNYTLNNNANQNDLNYYIPNDYETNQDQNNNYDLNDVNNNWNSKYDYLFEDNKNNSDRININNQEYPLNNYKQQSNIKINNKKQNINNQIVDPRQIYTEPSSKIVEDYPYHNIINNKDLIGSGGNIKIPNNNIKTIKIPGYIKETIDEKNKKMKLISNNQQIIKNELNYLTDKSQIPIQTNNNPIINNELKENVQNNPFNNVKVIPIKNNNINTIQKENVQNTDVIEVTDTLNNLQLFTKEVKRRPLTQEDYKKIFLTGVGIINLGNTCFINSCLQVLIHCKLFIENFFNKSNIITKETTPISYEFLLICIAMLDRKKNEESYIDISFFKQAFGIKHKTFKGFTQNDSQEFCRVFLDDLSTELNEAKNKNIYKALTNTEGKNKIERDKEFDLNFKEREKSIITELFYSQTINTFTCQCGSEIYSLQKILDFPLLLPENVDKIHINDLLKINFKNEIVDFETKCDKCNKIQKHKKTLRISRPPEILILSLQRINQTTKKKNQSEIVFSTELNLYDYIDHDCGFDKESNYTLFSVINHQGEMDFGHYFSYIQPSGSKNWFEFNDSLVRNVKVSITVYKEGYVLFYIKNKYK